MDQPLYNVVIRAILTNQRKLAFHQMEILKKIANYLTKMNTQQKTYYKKKIAKSCINTL